MTNRSRTTRSRRHNHPLVQSLDRRLLLSVSLVTADANGNATGGNANTVLNPASSTPFSPDGRFLVFSSSAPNLVPGVTDTNAQADYFLRDLQTNTTVCLSANAAGTALGISALTYVPTFSPDSKYLLFRSSGAGLVAGISDTNNAPDLFLRNLTTATTTVLSISADGTSTGNAASSGFSTDIPVFSPDSKFVAFVSGASNLVTNVTDTNGIDLFLRDLEANTTTQISIDANGAAAAGLNTPTFSPDGRYLAFIATSNNLAANYPDTNNNADIYIRDRQTGITRLVTRDTNNTAIGGGGTLQFTPAGLLIYSGTATQLPTDANQFLSDIYAYNPATDSLSLLSLNAAGTAGGDKAATLLTLSPNGRYVAFSSPSSNLTPQSDADVKGDLYVRDLTNNTTRYVALNSTSSTLFSDIQFSPDSSKLLFTSNVNNLSPIPDTNAKTDAYLYDLATSTYTLATVNAAGTAATSNTTLFLPTPAFSPDSRYLTFVADANDLVTGFTTSSRDLFVRDLQAGLTRAVTLSTFGNGSGFDQFATSTPTFSTDSKFLLFVNNGLLTANDANFVSDVFAFDLAAATNTLLSATPAGAAGNGAAGSIVLNPAGSTVLFSSSASDYTAATDAAGTLDLFTATLPTTATLAPEIGVTFNATPPVPLPSGSPATTPAGTAFGNINIGAFLDHTFTVTNSGSAPLTLSNLAVTGGFAITEGLSPTLAPGASDTFTLRFTANVPGPAAGTASFTTNDADESAYTFALSATAVVPTTNAPAATLTGNAVPITSGDTTPSITDHTDFGSTPVGSPLQRTYTLQNTGSAPLTITNLTIPAGFTVLNPFPATLDANFNGSLLLQFNAASAATFGGNITFSTNDPNIPTFSFAITATATPTTVPPPPVSPPPPPTDPAGPDLVIEGGVTSVKTGNFLAGAKGGKATVKVFNRATTSADGNLAVAFYASSDTTFDSADTLITTITKKVSLKSGKSATLSSTFNYPTPTPTSANTFYILAVADSANAFTESNESNNTTASPTPIGIAPPNFDLVPSALTAKGKYAAGKRGAASLTLAATGNSPAIGTITTQLFASTTGTLSGAISLGTTVTNLNLKPGKPKKLTLKADLTNLPAGSYTLIAQIDTTSALTETNEANNTTFSATKVSVS